MNIFWPECQGEEIVFTKTRGYDWAALTQQAFHCFRPIEGLRFGIPRIDTNDSRVTVRVTIQSAVYKDVFNYPGICDARILKGRRKYCSSSRTTTDERCMVAARPKHIWPRIHNGKNAVMKIFCTQVNQGNGFGFRIHPSANITYYCFAKNAIEM